MNYILNNCLNCQKEFNAPVREVNRGNGKFCCLTCSGLYNQKIKPKPILNASCAWCGKNFHKSPSKLKSSKSGLDFCSRKHKDEAQTLGGLKELHLPHFGNGNRCYRDIAFRVKPKICERCGFDKEPAIVIHHKDRNRSNNDISNLEVLCANCHLIEHLS